MMVMITMTPARVNPDSAVTRLRSRLASGPSDAPRLRDRATWNLCGRISPALVKGAVEPLAGSLAVYVVDARGGVVVLRGRIGGGRIRVRWIGSVLHFLPIGLSGDRVFGDVAQVVLLLQRLQALGVLLLVRVVVVERFPKFEEVVAQRRLARLGLRPFDVGDGDGGEDADDRDDDDQLDEGEAGLLSIALFHGGSRVSRSVDSWIRRLEARRLAGNEPDPLVY